MDAAESNEGNVLGRQLFQLLSANLGIFNEDQEKIPLLAHYTSIAIVETVLRTKTFWLSNPLLMNDHQELSYGVNTALGLARQHEPLNTALGSDQRQRLFFERFDFDFHILGTDQVRHLYVGCFSEHQNPDGILSMWRGYGGDGAGAALIIDMNPVYNKFESPLVLGKVIYSSDQEWNEIIAAKLNQIANFLQENALADEVLPYLAFNAFAAFKIMSLFRKHHGFAEEREWRLVYLPENDPNGLCQGFFSYHFGSSGVVPKMKLNLEEFLERVGDVGFDSLLTGC